VTELFYDEIPSPIGTGLIVCSAEGLCALEFGDCEPRTFERLRLRYGMVKFTRRHDPEGCRSRLQAYFEGDFNGLDSIRVSLDGTSFQRRVWEALRTIPAGKTVSYGQLAARLVPPSVARAVGLANSLNPIAIVVPCHRVVGAKGSLTGYAGGLERKRWLLAHEGALAKILELGTDAG
jgi:methylated-DNA-[protein]-cysteine S-methyltransferase